MIELALLVLAILCLCGLPVRIPLSIVAIVEVVIILFQYYRIKNRRK